MSNKDSKTAYNHENQDTLPSRFTQMMEYGDNLLALDVSGKIWERQDPIFTEDHGSFAGYTWKLVSR